MYLEPWNAKVSWVVKHLVTLREAGSGTESYHCRVASVTVTAGLHRLRSLNLPPVCLHDTCTFSTEHARTSALKMNMGIRTRRKPVLRCRDGSADVTCRFPKIDSKNLFYPFTPENTQESNVLNIPGRIFHRDLGFSASLSSPPLWGLPFLLCFMTVYVISASTLRGP